MGSEMCIRDRPRGCSDDEFPWCREGDPLDNKYFYTTHSELNAILNYRGGTLDGAKMYVTLFPCNECAKAIIQAGIKTVVYDSDKYADTASVIASKNVSAILNASSGPITLAPIQSTFALLCSLVACALKQSLHNAALIPLTLLAAILIPIPVPHKRIPSSHSPLVIRLSLIHI